MDLGDGRNLLSKQKVGSDKSGKSQRLIRVLPVEATWCYPTRYDSVDPLSPDWYRPIMASNCIAGGPQCRPLALASM
jgi:hypothetical protein